MVIILSGGPATGKSTLASILQRVLPGPLYINDEKGCSVHGSVSASIEIYCFQTEEKMLTLSLSHIKPTEVALVPVICQSYLEVYNSLNETHCPTL